MKQKAPAQIQTQISEIFSSLQGEGPYLGIRQIFVRFGRCNMHCGYCDELEKMKQGNYRSMKLDEVLSEIDRLVEEEGKPHSVSLTGGEPLMYPGFLEVFLPELKARGLGVYLETNGTYPEILKRFVQFFDVIAMDIKPPSSSQDRPFWAEHEAFLKEASGKDVFVKVVVTPETSELDMQKSMALVAAANKSIPFVFQPQSELTGISLAAVDRIRKFLALHGNGELEDVRVVPQMHKIWGIR